jgi:signal transduction histidine kinase
MKPAGMNARDERRRDECGSDGSRSDESAFVGPLGVDPATDPALPGQAAAHPDPMSRAAGPRPTRDRAGVARRRLGIAGYVALLGVCTLASLASLAIGTVVLAGGGPGASAAAARQGNRWAEGLMAAARYSAPIPEVALDYTFGLLGIGVAVVLLASWWRSWPVRLLALGLVSAVGAFTLQARAVSVVVGTATGIGLGELCHVLLHGTACAATVLALLIYPRAGDLRPRSVPARTLLTAALLLVGFGTALLPNTVGSVALFGLLVPVIGAAALLRRVRGGRAEAERTRARLLFSVLVAAIAIAVVLVVITGLLWAIGWDGLTLTDPTAPPGMSGLLAQTALLFWFSRLVAVAIGGAVLLAAQREGLWTAERLFGRGLVAALVAAIIGGGYLVVQTVVVTLTTDRETYTTLPATAVAIALSALAFQPVYARAEQLVDRVLYGTRPAPYSVLAEITALSRATAADAPDLARVAEAVGRGLGATRCRLTVFRPGLRDRSYTWAERGAPASDAEVGVLVRHADELIGRIAVDRVAVAGVHVERRRLLDDIADSLGAVLQASRSGIELERQLRAALAHAGEIAVSRRAAVAAMDGERRRIERDLHDGAQHHLVSLRLTLGLVEHQVSVGQFEPARARLDQVAEQIDTAESILAATASGVSSPLLAERGLAGALDVELAGGHPPVVVDCAEVGAGVRFPADVEAAVWFCCLEAVNNARKHAQGATVRVRLGVADGRLCFTVADDGPGWDAEAGAGSPGRGLRNVRARIAVVGGRIEIRSKPGAGTTVEGSVPVPGPATARQGPDRPGDGTAGDGPVGVGPVGVGPVGVGTRAPRATGVAATGVPLLDQVGDLVRAAGELYEGTPQASRVRELARRLGDPLRIAVAGPPGAGTSTPVGMLADGGGAWPHGSAAGDPTPPAVVVDAQDPDAPPEPDAYVQLLRHGHPEDAEAFAARFAASRPGPQRHRPVPTIGVQARADGVPTDPVRFADRAGTLKARSVLLALDALVRLDPPPAGGWSLLYALDRIRSGGHQLSDIDLVDALLAGEHDLPDAERRTAVQLLGGAGTDLRARLALAADAGPQELVWAATAQLQYWQRRESRPTTERGVRTVAAALVRACEELLVAGAATAPRDVV